MLSFNEKLDILLAKIDARFDRLEAKMDAMIAKLDGNIVNVNRRYVETDASLVKKETVLKEANIEVNRIELSLENNEMRFYSGTPTTTNYECKEIINVDISEHEVIEEQSNLEIVNDMEVDWDEDIIFEHSSIESKPFATEQHSSEVESLFLPSKYSSESLVSVTQQESNAMKYVATDVEVILVNVLNVETELNSFAQFKEGLPRKIWDPGLDIMLL